MRIWRAILSSRLVLTLASILTNLGYEAWLGLAATDAERGWPDPRKELQSKAELAILKNFPLWFPTSPPSPQLISANLKRAVTLSAYPLSSEKFIYLEFPFYP